MDDAERSGRAGLWKAGSLPMAGLLATNSTLKTARARTVALRGVMCTGCYGVWRRQDVHRLRGLALFLVPRLVRVGARFFFGLTQHTPHHLG
jgi:hypothetical protein